MKAISIHIGGIEGSEPTTWHPVETNAPKDFDGFGTFEVVTYDDEKRGNVRLVLVREEHYTWQTMRYSSGWYQWEESQHDEAAIVEELWKRIQGKD